jgi:hypothetical protein
MGKEALAKDEPGMRRTNRRRQPLTPVAAQPAAAVARVLGNGAVQRLVAQRSTGPAELDDALAARITSARASGSALDAHVQKKMGEGLDADFSGVRVHTGPESHALNEQLSARAFTTGPDIFFRDGEYNPHTSGGQELLAHELTHVVQQGSGEVPHGSRMAVNAPGDRFEQEADSVARTLGSTPTPQVQRQELPDDEDMLAQTQEMPEEDEVGTV